MFTWGDLYIMAAIVVVNGLLSVDNGLVVATLATLLPVSQQGRAIRFGLAVGAGLRVVMLWGASLIMRYPSIKILGAAYLLYLGVKNLFFSTGESKKKEAKSSFWSVIVSIALADAAFSIDNVVASVGMSPKLSVVITGVLVGIICMIFATQLIAVLVRRYPSLANAAYVIVAFVGVTIIADELFGISLDETTKFLAIISVVGLTVAYEEARNWRARHGIMPNKKVHVL